MPFVATKGCFVGAGVILIGDPTILINGKPVAIKGSLVSKHPPCPMEPSHCAALIAIGSSGVLANGKPVTYVGALATCKHPVLTGAVGVTVTP